MIEFDRTGQPVLPARTREYDGVVTTTTAPSTLIVGTGDSATYTVLDGSAGQGGIQMVSATPSGSSTNATVYGPDINPTDAVAVKIRCVFDMTRSTISAVQAIDTASTRGFGIGKYWHGADTGPLGETLRGANRFIARAAAGALYVKSNIVPFTEDWDTTYNPAKRYDVSILCDIPGKSLYVAEGNQWTDMWENISAMDVNGIIRPQFRLVAQSTAQASSAILRRLTTTLYYK